MKTRRIPLGELASLDAEWIDRDRRPYIRTGTAYVPVKEGFAWEVEIPERRRFAGRKYFLTGSVAVIQGEEPTGEEVREIERWVHPSGVLWVRSCQGVQRIPDAKLLSGSCSPVCHRELGMVFWLDPSEVMYSRGNLQEKVRMMQVVRKGERIADMFAGIGYFSLPAARAGARVHAMELNPVAFGYLCRNVSENHVVGHVLPECGDCRHLLFGWYDRIIMGHFDSPAMLDRAVPHALPGGSIHLHMLSSDTPGIPGGYQDCLAVERTRRIKKVAPHMWHYVLDLRVR